MNKVKDIKNAIERLAPCSLAEEWDNVGLMLGDAEQYVSTVFICLDVTSENVQKAIDCDADLIISHHPLIFSPLKNILDTDVSGSIISTLIRNNISVYSAHTNLDKADGGMNDVLADKLALSDVRHFKDGTIGRIGELETPVELADFKDFVKNVLDCRSIRYVGTPDETVKTVAVCSGAGGDGIYSAYNEGADVYVTSDIKHHEAQLAYELGINLIDAGHFETENIICEFLKEYLEEIMPDITVFSSDAEPFFR